MKKNIFIWILTFILLISSVSASVVIFEDDFDDASINTSKWTETDPCSNIVENSGYLQVVRSGSCGSAQTGSLIAKISGVDLELNSNYTVTGKVFVADQYAGVGGHQATLYYNYFDNDNYMGYFPLSYDGSNYRSFISIRENSITEVTGSNIIKSFNNWHDFNYTVFGNGTIALTIDGTSEYETNTFGFSNSGPVQIYYSDGTQDTSFNYDVRYDDIKIYNLSASEPSSDINDSTESTAVVKQVGSISFSGGAPTTIFSSDFNITYDDTPLYGGYTFQVASNGNNEMFCELLINGTSYANVTRTQYSGETAGNVYIKFPTTIIPNNGTYNQALECSRTSGTGLITITNAVGIGHFLVDQSGEFLNYNTTTISKTVTSGSSYTLLDSLNITIGNKTNTSSINPRKNHIVIDGSFTYTNNGASTETPSIYANVNGTNCTTLPRTTSSGGVASVSYDCNIFNVTENAIYQIDFYGNGTNIVYKGDVTAKNFFLSNNEIIGGTGILKGATFSNNTYTTLISGVEGGNNNHDLANVFNKLSFAITTDVDTTVSIYFNITNGGEYLTNVWQRDFLAGETGVMIGQDVIESLPKDDYNISLHANCGTVGATCTISGGQTGGYLTDVVTTIVNSFDVTAYNEWNNNSLINFNVTDGATVTSVNGTATYFSTDTYENLTISAIDYFDTVVLNHNTSEDLNVSLRQSDIKFRATQIVTGDYVAPANFTVNGVTKGVNESFYLSSGTYNVTFSKNGWYNTTQEFTVSALDNKTVTVTSVSDSAINITAYHFIDNATITNFSGWVYEASTMTNISFSTTTGSAIVSAANGTTFSIHIESDGYASIDDSFVVNNTPVFSYNASFYSFNSVYVTIYDLFTGNLITQNVSIDVISDVYSTVTSTVDGTKYLTVLTPESYELRFASSGYVTSSYFITVNNDSSQDLTVYLLNSTNTYNVTINVIDESAQNVEGAVVKASRYDIDSNTFLLYAAGTTNSDGDVVLSLTYNDEYYKFTVEVDGVTKKVTAPQYITGTTLVIQIVLSELAGSDYYNYLGIDSSLVFNTLTDNFRFTYNDVDGLGSSYCLYVYRLSALGDTLVNSSCSASSSGTILLGVTPVNGTTYVARAYYDSEFLDDESYSYPKDGSTRELGLLMQLFLTLVFGLIAFADLGLLPIALGASLIFGKLAMLNAFGWPGIAAFMVIMIFISAGMYGFRG